MKITVVYDNCSVRAGLGTGWGFSSLIETDDAPPLLFDTGDDGVALLYNMKQLGIDPSLIGTIVISHHHGDHTGGLYAILEKNKHAEIYVPASIRARLPGRKVVSVSQSVQISETVFSTGELKSIEQSLAIKTSKGILVSQVAPILESEKFSKPLLVMARFTVSSVDSTAFVISACWMVYP